MDGQLVTIGNADTITQGLVKMDDNPHLQQKLYPKLTKEAGNQKYPLGVLLLIELALSDYCQGLPGMMATLMQQKVPAIIKALIPDETEQALVLQEYEKVIVQAQG